MSVFLLILIHSKGKRIASDRIRGALGFSKVREWRMSLNNLQDVKQAQIPIW